MPVHSFRSFPCLQVTLLVFVVYLFLLGALGDLDLVWERLPSESDPEYLVVLTALVLDVYDVGVCDLSLFFLSPLPLLLLLLLLAAWLLPLDVDLAFLMYVLSQEEGSLDLLLHAFS